MTTGAKPRFGPARFQQPSRRYDTSFRGAAGFELEASGCAASVANFDSNADSNAVQSGGVRAGSLKCLTYPDLRKRIWANRPERLFETRQVTGSSPVAGANPQVRRYAGHWANTVESSLTDNAFAASADTGPAGAMEHPHPERWVPGLVSVAVHSRQRLTTSLQSGLVSARATVDPKAGRRRMSSNNGRGAAVPTPGPV